MSKRKLIKWFVKNVKPEHISIRIGEDRTYYIDTIRNNELLDMFYKYKKKEIEFYKEVYKDWAVLTVGLPCKDYPNFTYWIEGDADSIMVTDVLSCKLLNEFLRNLINEIEQ